MVESLAVPNPSPVEAPKPGAASPKTQKAGGAPSSGSPSFAGALAYAREDIGISYRSKDGDVLEVRRSVTVAAGYTRVAAGGGEARTEGNAACGGEGCLEAGAEKGRPEDIMKWAREVARQMEEQQVRLLGIMLRGDGEEKGVKEARLVMFDLLSLTRRAEAEGEVEAIDEEYGVPEYWNAEHTSDRIVAFATSFAGIFGDDQEFAGTLIDAVAEGFRQAGDILGELPGMAGKLNRDTRDLTFAKLDKWIEARKSGPYNVEAQKQVLEPA